MRNYFKLLKFKTIKFTHKNRLKSQKYYVNLAKFSEKYEFLYKNFSKVDKSFKVDKSWLQLDKSWTKVSRWTKVAGNVKIFDKIWPNTGENFKLFAQDPQENL